MTQPETHPSRLEVRVHGVSGTPPEDLLDRPLVHQVDGDATAGFYRPRLADERLDDRANPEAPAVEDAPELVGYCWGGLTSGSAGRALWLALLPFTLINVAPRARPAGDNRVLIALIWFLCRLIALAVTGLFVLTGVGVGVDLMGWQCAHTTTCEQASPTTVFGHVFREHELSDEHMLLIGAAAPVLLLLLLWFVSKRTFNRYERTVSGKAPTGDENSIEVGLESGWMWRNADQVRRLRATHMQAGFALALWCVAAPTEPHGVALTSHPLSAIAIVVMAWSVFCLAWPSWVGHGRHSGLTALSVTAWIALGVGWSWLAAGLAFDGGWIHPNWLTGRVTSQRGIPRFAETVVWDFLIALGALVLLIVVVAVAAIHHVTSPRAGDHARQRAGLAGLTTVAFAALGVFLGAAMTAGIYAYVGGWLTTGSVKPGFSEVGAVYQRFAVPDAVRAASQAFLVSSVVLVALIVFVGAVFAGGLLLTSRVTGAVPLGGVGAVLLVALGLDLAADTVHLRPWLITLVSVGGGALVVLAMGSMTAGRHVKDAAIDTDYAPATRSDDPGRWKSIWRAIYLARLVDCVPVLVAPMVASGLVLVVAFTGSLLPVGPAVKRPAGYVDRVVHLPLGLTTAGVGAYLTVLFLLGLIALGLLAFRTAPLRRSVGILWDVASFWPRASHPLAAPCYAERTVPDLVTYLSAQPADRTIVLAAHSQGTVISSAVIRQLRTHDGRPDGPVLSRLGYLSFGCVLRRLYGRYFPAYFGPAELDELQQCLTRPGKGSRTPRWRNLWRWTDYLGGWVSNTISGDSLVPGPAWEVHRPDPPRFARSDEDTCFSRPHRHSDFWKDESGFFQETVAELADQVERDRAQPVTTSPNGAAAPAP